MQVHIPTYLRNCIRICTQAYVIVRFQLVSSYQYENTLIFGYQQERMCQFVSYQQERMCQFVSYQQERMCFLPAIGAPLSCGHIRLLTAPRDQGSHPRGGKMKTKKQLPARKDVVEKDKCDESGQIVSSDRIVEQGTNNLLRSFVPCKN